MIVECSLSRRGTIVDVPDGACELQICNSEGEESHIFFICSPATAITMEMKKIACAALVAAVSATSALAAEAPAPGPASASFAVTPAVGAAIAASFLSFFAFYLQ
ncbi:hypothetical protein ZIOFF_011178 [Zingiber officinale]|uniref:Uncharacterized protein n=1 Tax=Zingiber officinale TaxID=94328 RepID=A0A8J5HK48_ZINOF|nr:hypothetical protein ZIOFF_011178 [Zingiber officinale]